MTYTLNRTVERALDILELIAVNNEEGFTFSEIVRELNIPKGSLHPLLGSLCNRRFLYLNEKEKRYYLGEELFNLGNRFLDKTNILTLVEKVLEQISNETGYTTFFGVLSGSEVLYLLRKIGPGNLTIVASPKRHLKAHCTGLGKALLLDTGRAEMEKLFEGGLPRVTEKTITDLDTLYEQIQQMKQDGFAYEREESSAHIQCLSLPIRYQGSILAAVSVSFPAFDGQEAEKEQIKSALQKGRREIETIVSNNISKWIYSDVK